MPKNRNPKRDKAFKIWKDSKGNIPLIDIALKLKLAPGTIRSWKSQDKWEFNKKNSVDVVQRNRNVVNDKKQEQKVIKKDTIKKEIKKREFEDDIVTQIREFEGLTERDKTILLGFMKCKNRTQAALNAGVAKNIAHVVGSKVVSKVKSKEFMRMIQDQMYDDLYTDAQEVLAQLLKIAFSNMTNYASWGTRKSPLLDGNGNKQYDENEQVILEYQSYVDFKPSDEVDGTLVQKIGLDKHGGLKFELIDKTPILKSILDIMDITGDRAFNRDSVTKKLELEKARVKEVTDSGSNKTGLAKAINKKMLERKGDLNG